MAKKSILDSKLGSWTDQASLTQAKAQTNTNQIDPNHPSKGKGKISANREKYHVPQTLICRSSDLS